MTQAGLFQERHAEIFFFYHESPGRQRVVNLVAPLGDDNLIPRAQELLLDILAIDLCSVRAAQVFDVPDAFDKIQFAVPAGDIGKTQTDIARFPTAKDHVVLNERNRIAATHWDQFRLFAGWIHGWVPML